MKYQLNPKIANLEPYTPLVGEYKVRLDANESFYDADPTWMKAFQTELNKLDFQRYPDPYCQSLCKAFGGYYGVNPNYVTVGNGSDELISIIVNSFALRGETVYCIMPDFSMYAFYGYLAECNVVEAQKGPDLRIDIDKVIEEVNVTGAAMVLFSNPCNPTSLGLKREDVRKLITSVEALVVLDEAYMDFWDQSLLSEGAQYDNLIILKTCSKALGLAGVRVGFAVANETITNALRAVKSPYNVNTISQTAAELLFRDPATLQKRTQDLIDGRKSLQEALGQLSMKYPVLEQVFPSSTNFVFIRCAKANEIYQKLLERSIAIRQFNGYLRICTGSPEENELFLTALKEILEEK